MLYAIATLEKIDMPDREGKVTTLNHLDSPLRAVKLVGQNIEAFRGVTQTKYVYLVRMDEGTPRETLIDMFPPFVLYGMAHDDSEFWRFYAQVLDALDIPPHSIWKHHKNGYYRLDQIANMIGDRTGKFRPTIIYTSLASGQTFARIAEEWFDKFSFAAFRGQARSLPVLVQEQVQFKKEIQTSGTVFHERIHRSQ